MRRAIYWFKINSLVANPDKFQFMILGTKRKSRLKLEINGRSSISTSSVTLLGIKIDWKLSFNAHVQSICKKANQKTGALMRIRNDIQQEQKLTLYHSFILSSFSYCPLVWMFCGIVADARVNRVQLRALRAVYNDFSSSKDDILRRGEHPTIHERNLNLLIMEVYKCINKDSPPILHELFQTKEPTYDLRVNNLLVLPTVSTQSYGTQALRYRGSTTWNHIPDEIKSAKTPSILKNILKGFKFSHCTCKICI